jgi:hypothetical protein
MPEATREKRLERAPHLAPQGVTTGLTASIGSNDGTYGILGAQTYERRDFSDHDVTFSRLSPTSLSVVDHSARSVVIACMTPLRRASRSASSACISYSYTSSTLASRDLASMSSISAP